MINALKEKMEHGFKSTAEEEGKYDDDDDDVDGGAMKNTFDTDEACIAYDSIIRCYLKLNDVETVEKLLIDVMPAAGVKPKVSTLKQCFADNGNASPAIIKYILDYATVCKLS